MSGELGRTLREARRRRRLRLDRIARQTRIPERYLRALEEERLEELPGAFYARSCLRQYARALGLDGEALVEEYRELLCAVEDEPALAPAPRGAWAGARRLGLAAGALALAAAGLLWALRPERAPAPPLATARPAQVPAAAEGPRPAPARRQARRAPVPAHVSLVAARGDCWLLVRAGSERGPVLYEGTLRTGASIRFRRPRLWMRLGAPWNVELRVDGRPSGELALASGPANVLVTRRGVRPAPRARLRPTA